MIKKHFLLSAILVLLAGPAFAEQINAVGDKVIDGDTILATAGGKQYTVTLAYIVAPELKQKFGPEAKKFVESLALNQSLKIKITGRQYDMITGEVFSPKKQESINRELTRAGLAWPIEQKDKKHPYDLSISLAKKRRLGVWSDPTLQPPAPKSGTDIKKTTASGAAQGYASPAPSAGASGSGGNVMMRHRKNLESIANKKEAQQSDVQ